MDRQVLFSSNMTKSESQIWWENLETSHRDRIIQYHQPKTQTDIHNLFLLNKRKYVVLEHLTMPQRGFRFWSSNAGVCLNTHGTEDSPWYKEVLFTDSEREATELSSRNNKSVMPTLYDLEKYYANHPHKY